MVISVLASHLFLDFHVSPTFVAGAAAVLGSIHLYSKA
jgi:hypothetical protein